jgi:hypothetical protein
MCISARRELIKYRFLCPVFWSSNPVKKTAQNFTRKSHVNIAAEWHLLFDGILSQWVPDREILKTAKQFVSQTLVRFPLGSL